MNEYFVKMNQRLDEGWKLTDTNCPFCSASVMISPSLKDFFCCKCNKSVEIEIEEEEVENKSSVLNNLKQEDKINKQEETFNEIDYKNLKKQQEIISNKTNQSSKKMSDKLLKGWTMLEDCCPDCFVPLMKKKNEIMCVGCDCSFPKENNKKNLNNVIIYLFFFLGVFFFIFFFFFLEIKEARVIIDKEVGNTCEDKIKEKNSKNLKFDNKEIESQNLKYQKFTFECYANLS